MKAVVYEKGSIPEALVLRDVEKPLPGDGEVLIRIHAVSVNAADYRSMKLGIVPKRRIFGADIAGRIESVGKNVRRFSVGDDVFGDLSGCGFGGFAEYVTAPDTAMAAKPASIPFEIAAAVPMAAVTALQGLRDEGCIQKGQKVLIYGAGGGVGTFAVQFARHFGTEVTAVCGTGNVPLIRSLGAERVIDYHESGLIGNGSLFDLVLAVNGNRPLSAYKRLLAPGGICVVIGGALPQVLKAMLFGRLLSSGNRKIRILKARPDADDLAFVMGLVESGQVKPVIDRTYRLDETAEGVRYVSGGHARGKVVINIADDPANLPFEEKSSRFKSENP